MKMAACSWLLPGFIALVEARGRALIKYTGRERWVTVRVTHPTGSGHWGCQGPQERKFFASPGGAPFFQKRSACLLLETFEDDFAAGGGGF